ncbi:hypothetical protein KR038_009705 [Drosophila bunnanda]|nr:hypothetical protein KR038_009705 [Drosophila bunnanda]
MRSFAAIAFVFLAFGACPFETESAKILAALPFPGQSQYIFMKTYLMTLATRGHQVTVINAFANSATPNMRFIEVPKLLQCYEEMEVNWFKVLPKLVVITLEDDGVQALLKSGETFDLVLVEMELVEALYGLAEHFNASLAGFLSFGTHDLVDEALGNVSPISYNPIVTSSRTDQMTFPQRLANHYEYLVDKAYRHFVHLPVMNKLYEKYFTGAKLTMGEAINSISLVLLGDHFSLGHSRPLLPNMIEVGGMHISHKPSPLPEDIRQFIEDSPDGVIYFAMGSHVNTTELPQETLDALLKTFASLKQRVLWKFENQIPGKPDNVLIKEWFPQADILAHPNVKLFISHGGQLSIAESVYFGKPLLGLPCFFDQFRNVLRAQKLGFGLGLNVQDLKQSELEQAIQTLLTSPSYTKATAAISERFRDQQETSLDRAVWWTEYIIRHNGAPYLRAASRDLNFIQLHSLDTLAVLVGVPLLIVLVLLKLYGKVKGLLRFNKVKKQQ